MKGFWVHILDLDLDLDLDPDPGVGWKMGTKAVVGPEPVRKRQFKGAIIFLFTHNENFLLKVAKI